LLFRNTAFQLIGRGSSLLSGLIAVPVFLHYLGAETYGVVGVYISLMALSGLFDLGLPISINQKISAMRAAQDPITDISRVVRSFELIILCLSFAIFLTIFLLAPFIGGYWLNLVTLDTGSVTQSLQVAGLAIVLRFPTAFYSNCLYAFDLHGRSNTLTTLASILRVVVAVVVFEVHGVNLETFFWSQVFANGFELLFLAIMTWRTKLIFWTGVAAKKSLGQSLSMVFGLTGISISALFLSQVDKIILSKAVPLDVFGLYSVAYSLAMGLLPIAYSIGNAVFPELSRMIKSSQVEELNARVHKAFQLKRLTVLPVAGIMIFMSDHLVSLLSLFSARGEEILRYLPYLAAGALLQSYTVVIYSFKVAQEKPNILFLINITALFVFSGLYGWAAVFWGGYGVCVTFLALNIFIFCAQTLSVLRLPEHSYWGGVIIETIGKSAVALLGMLILSMLIPRMDNVIIDTVVLSGVACLVSITVFLAEKK